MAVSVDKERQARRRAEQMLLSPVSERQEDILLRLDAGDSGVVQNYDGLALHGLLSRGFTEILDSPTQEIALTLAGGQAVAEIKLLAKARIERELTLAWIAGRAASAKQAGKTAASELLWDVHRAISGGWHTGWAPKKKYRNRFSREAE